MLDKTLTDNILIIKTIQFEIQPNIRLFLVSLFFIHHIFNEKKKIFINKEMNRRALIIICK